MRRRWCIKVLPVSQSQKSSPHHASDPITTFHLRVNNQELDYQNDEITKMTISLYHNSNGPLQAQFHFCECQISCCLACLCALIIQGLNYYVINYTVKQNS